MIEGEHRLDRPFDHDPLVAEHRDAVADGEQAIEIVGDHEHREAERVAQARDERVEVLRADRIKAEVGSSRNTISGSKARARASAARFTMPPDSSEGYLSAASGARPTRLIFRSASSRMSFFRQLQVLRMGTMMFWATVSDENNAPC